MTAPCPETLDREKDKLLLTDAEIIRRLGVPYKIGLDAIRALDSNPRSGFPQKQDMGKSSVLASGARFCRTHGWVYNARSSGQGEGQWPQTARLEYRTRLD
jgi:hypothetical protein